MSFCRIKPLGLLAQTDAGSQNAAGAELVRYTADTALTASGRQCNKACLLRVLHVKAARTVCCCVELSGPDRIEIIAMLATGNYRGRISPNIISCLTHTVTLTATGSTGVERMLHPG